jgi:hypothetical protein
VGSNRSGETFPPPSGGLWGIRSAGIEMKHGEGSSWPNRKPNGSISKPHHHAFLSPAPANAMLFDTPVTTRISPAYLPIRVNANYSRCHLWADHSPHSPATASLSSRCGMQRCAGSCGGDMLSIVSSQSTTEYVPQERMRELLVPQQHHADRTAPLKPELLKGI